METLFFVAGLIAIVATLRVITAMHPVHALLYLIVSLLAVALVFFTLGAPFAAALEVIVYAGAIMVLFVFVMMMLNLGRVDAERERSWLTPGMWVGPAVLAALLLVELVFLVVDGAGAPAVHKVVGPKAVGIALFGPYVLGVELASMLLLAGLVGAYHVGRARADETD
jgi:NADH-quinone oxidoreductase subunit J